MNLRRYPALMLSLLVVACGGGGAESSRPPATAACEAVEFPRLQGGLHLIGDREPPVPYSSTPPTSGWHTLAGVDIGVRGEADPLTEPEQVGILELGGIVVTHGALSPPLLEELHAFVRQHYDGRVAVTPYDELDGGAVAFTAWGALQRCEELDLEALAAFADAYGAPGPDLPAEHVSDGPGP